MTLRRRNLFGLFGAAIAAPLLPLPTFGVTYAKSAMHVAITHAQARVSLKN